MDPKKNNGFLLELAQIAARGVGEENARISWETPITVVVDGAIISGHVISQEQYFQILMEGFRNARTRSGTGDAEIAEAAWRGVVEGLEKNVLNNTLKDDDFMYLKDVIVFNVTRGGPFRHVAWAVRCSHIGAVALGNQLHE